MTKPNNDLTATKPLVRWKRVIAHILQMAKMMHSIFIHIHL